jgi:hypothetical protein
MNSIRKTARILEDVKISTKMKLSALWAALLFCYIFGDINSFFIPGGYITQSLAGKIGPFQVTQGSMLGLSVFDAIPCVMVFVSLVLKPKASRWANIILGVFQTVANSVAFLSSSWAFFVFFGIVESVLSGLIVWYAWKWPKFEVGPDVET